MKEFKFKINGALYEVSVESIEDSLAEVVVNGKAHQVEVLTEVQMPKPRPIVTTTVKTQTSAPAVSVTTSGTGPRPSGNGKPILSPLPGLILELKVKEGDQVKKGDVILVMEAMKMENNILTEFDGVISSLKVTKGQNVMQNDVLVEIV